MKKATEDKLRNFKLTSKLPFWYLAPVIILLVAIIVFASISGKTGSAADGFGVGIDFTGGTELTVLVADNAENEARVKKVVESKTRANAPKVDYIQGVESGESVGIRVKYKNSIDDATAMKELNDAIKSAMYVEFGVDEVTDETSFVVYTNTSSTASSDLIKKAVIAAVISIVLILIYIVIRFEYLSGIAAVLALMHDVIIMVSITVICRIPINSSFVAAVITIIAYSINNTIVVFDRVRERRKTFDKKNVPYASLADEAVISTLNRTMFTTATTLIMVVMLTILGVTSMRNFTLPILFGLIAGTYSSVFLAAPTWAAMNNGIIKYRAKKFAQYKAQK